MTCARMHVMTLQCIAMTFHGVDVTDMRPGRGKLQLGIPQMLTIYNTLVGTWASGYKYHFGRCIEVYGQGPLACRTSGACCGCIQILLDASTAKCMSTGGGHFCLGCMPYIQTQSFWVHASCSSCPQVHNPLKHGALQEGWHLYLVRRLHSHSLQVIF